MLTILRLVFELIRLFELSAGCCTTFEEGVFICVFVLLPKFVVCCLVLLVEVKSPITLTILRLIFEFIRLFKFTLGRCITVVVRELRVLVTGPVLVIV
ncbi:MAG: hypothetical protein JW715_02880 [Sedimentisphaerales bacterium]|nr:hypothetical protein [Sedimentisphaerales bacterium]